MNIFPDGDLDDPLFETQFIQKLHDLVQSTPSIHGKGQLGTLKEDRSSGKTDVKTEDLLDTMIEVTGHLNIDGRGHCDFHGDFGGLSFLRRIGERCNQLLGTDSRLLRMSSELPLPQASGLARSLLSKTGKGRTTTTLLPTRTVALRLTKIALDDACCLLKFIHQPSFDALLHRVYDIEAENYTSEEENFLPLLYMTLAIGELFSPRNKDQQSHDGAADQLPGLVFPTTFPFMFVNSCEVQNIFVQQKASWILWTVMI